jgi:HD-like signal output (HDOD) protein
VNVIGEPGLENPERQRMNINQDTSTDTAFGANFGEKERMALYNVGKVRNLSQGEVLIKRAQRSTCYCLVLNGSFEIAGINGDGNFPAFRKDDLISEQAVFDSDASISAILASEPSRVLLLNEVSIRALSTDLQIAILKHVMNFSNTRFLKIKRQLASTSLKRQALTNNLIHDSRRRAAQYENSELVLNLLKKIPRLPIHVIQLTELLLSDNVSTRRVTELAKQDPSLVGEVLKEINSAHYGVRQKVSDLYYAIMLMGFNEVYQILISSGLRRTMPDSENFREIYQHSLILSYIAFELCQFHDKQRASLLSTISLLHDLGKSTVYLIEKENPKLAFFVQLLDPCRIGSMLLEKWNIPKVVCETIEFQSFPSFSLPMEIPSEFRKNIAILHCSHAIYDITRDKSNVLSDYPFLEEHKNFCGLQDKNLEQVVEQVIKNLKGKAPILPPEVKKFVMAHAS